MASQSHSSIDGNVSLKVISFNARGLRTHKKRRALFHIFKKKNYDIICIQESHLIKSDSSLIDKDWCSKYHLAEGTKNSKGLLTLFNKRFQETSLFPIKVSDRCLISQLTIDNMSFYIVNVYAPCIDAEKYLFLNNITHYVNEIQPSQDLNLIILGDFNTVLDNKLDIISGEAHADRIVNRFKHFVNELLISDIWRYLHGNKKEFTWSRNKPFIARRLDFIFTSENLLPFCKDSHISHLGFSDHKAVYLNIDFSSFKRGPSYFKFNVSLLGDIELVNEISKEITRIKSLDLDPHLKWEYIKASIRDIGNMYGKIKARDKRKSEKLIMSQMTELQNHIINFPDDEEAIKAIDALRNKLEIFNIREAEGARIRAGQKWAQEGEKCTKFFLNLEKQRSNSNTIFSLTSQSGDVIRDPIDILENVRSYFLDIYREDNSIYSEEASKIFLDERGGNVLEENDKIILNKELTLMEISNALKKSNNNSAPGSDGLPGEVYKVLWKDIQDPLLECFNHSFETGNLSSSQTAGIICLHHKGKGLPRDILNNWRPISLTNFDYKLLAKSMAIRLNSCLSKCINGDQYAFIKGRQVSDLLREIENIMQIGKKKFPESIILSLDYAKAFDTISLSAIKKALSYFGFDGNFVKWIELLLNGRKSRIQNGGYLSEYFQMERGVRQGCPISPLLFILTLELLARHIRTNDDIKGLQFSERVVKIKLYADDATLFLRDMIDYREVLSRIKTFSLFSGLCLNKQKSAAMMIANTEFMNKIKFGIKFFNRVKILGIFFSNECCADEISENYDKRIDQLERVCNLWGKRFLTLIGRITILKSFGLSLFIYLMQSIGIGEEYLNKINTILYRFIWNPQAKKCKKVIEKVKRETLNKTYEQGGLNMVDIRKMQDSFYLKWADRLFDSNDSSIKNTAIYFFEKVGGTAAFVSDLVSSEFKGLYLVDNTFWKNVLRSWLNYKNLNNSNVKRVPSIHEPIFNNRCIRFKNRVLFIERCIKLKIIFIKDFLVNGEIMPFRIFNDYFNNAADSMLVYNTLFNALNRFGDHFKIEFENGMPSSSATFQFRDLQIGKLDRRMLYNEIRCSEVENVKEMWINLFHLDDNDPEIWCVARQSSSEIRLIELQWKILHAVYPTGVLLNKMKIKNNNLCESCGDIDTLLHFFVTCSIAKVVWEEAEKIISFKCGRRVELSDQNKIIGIFSRDHLFGSEHIRIINMIILVCKKTISKFKCEATSNIKLLLESQLRFRGLLQQ